MEPATSGASLLMFATLIKDLRTQLAGASKSLAYVCSPILLVLLVISLQNRVPSHDLTRDPLAIADLPFYFGVVSNLGAIAWSAAAAICLFAFFSTDNTIVDRRLRSYLLFSGLLTSMLLFDDLFLLHEQFFPEYLSVPKRMVIAAYGVLTMLHFAAFRRIVKQTEYFILAIALAFFGVSLFVDLVPSQSLPFFWRLMNYVVEDGAKLLGIAVWLVYFSRVSAAALIAGKPSGP